MQWLLGSEYDDPDWYALVIYAAIWSVAGSVPGIVRLIRGRRGR